MTREIFVSLILSLAVQLLAPLAGGEEKKLDVLERGRRLAEEREKLEEELIAIVKKNGKDYHERKRQREAVELLGRIGTAKAVPVLVAVFHDYFEPTPPGVSTIHGITIVHTGWQQNPPTPSMQALAALGPLAVEALVEALVSEPHIALVPTWYQGLEMLPCRELAIAVARKRFGEEKGTEPWKRLRSLLGLYLRDRKWVESRE